MKYFRLLAAFATMVLAACSGLKALDIITPHTGYDVQKDIAYGDLPRQKLDLYTPTDQKSNHTVILFFYGGSWQEGSKDLYRFVGQALADKGYTVAVADYRVYPQAYFPDFINDGAKAFVWLHTHAKEYGGNADRIFVAGHSAGAHIAMMMTLNTSYITAAGGNADWIRGTIGLAGPYDFLPFTSAKVKALFSHAKDEDTQPINFVRKGTPPILLLTGDADEDVSVTNSIKLAQALKDHGDAVTLHIYPGVNHVNIALSLQSYFHSRAPALEDIIAFVDTH